MRTLSSGVVVGDLDQAMSRRAEKGKKKKRGGRKIRALRAKALAAAQSADMEVQDGAAASALPSDSVGIEPLALQEPVKSGAMAGDAREDEGVVAADGAAHMGAELRVGSVVVLPAVVVCYCPPVVAAA
jgi:hypothetical protein